MIINQQPPSSGGGGGGATHTLNIDTSFFGSGSFYIEIYDKHTDTWLRNPSQITYEADQLLLLRKYGSFGHNFSSSDGSSVTDKLVDSNGRCYAFRMPDADTSVSFHGSGGGM